MNWIAIILVSIGLIIHTVLTMLTFGQVRRSIDALIRTNAAQQEQINLLLRVRR